MLYLGLVLNLHISRSQQLGVDPLGQTHVDILPRRPNGQSKAERPGNAEHRIPDDPPQEGIQEEEHEIHDVHDRERERSLVPAKCVAEVLVVAAVDLHTDHDLDRVLERQREEEVRLRELAAEDEEPE